MSDIERNKALARRAGGKIVERWDSLDWLGAYQQLGLITVG